MKYKLKENAENMLLKQENKQLKDNWNKLRKCLNDVIYSYDNIIFEKTIESVLDAMQELEGSDKRDR